MISQLFYCLNCYTISLFQKQNEKAAHKKKIMKKIRAVRSGVNTGVDKSGSDFWSNLPTDLLRRTEYNADVVSSRK